MFPSVLISILFVTDVLLEIKILRMINTANFNINQARILVPVLANKFKINQSPIKALQVISETRLNAL